MGGGAGRAAKQDFKFISGRQKWERHNTCMVKPEDDLHIILQDGCGTAGTEELHGV